MFLFIEDYSMETRNVYIALRVEFMGNIIFTIPINAYFVIIEYFRILKIRDNIFMFLKFSYIEKYVISL